MEKIQQDAHDWVFSNQTDEATFSMERKDSESDKLLFTVTNQENTVRFTVTCPVDVDGQWSVWSEDESLQEYLGPILEYCESARDKSVADLLDKINAVLPKVFEGVSQSDDDDDDDDEEVDDVYYNMNDGDGEDTEVKPRPEPDDSNSSDEDERFFQNAASTASVQRLVKDLKNMQKEAQKFGFEGTPRGNNLFIWDVKLTGFSSDTQLGKDIQNWAEKHKREPVVYLEMQFPGDYPMAPPFVRVIRPRFKFLTGHVTIGGSICMEMLTKSGWTPANDIEGILVQIRSEIMSDPNARLDPNPDREYEEAEARDAFNRMVSRYGWNK